jgi:hypothetical protein
VTLKKATDAYLEHLAASGKPTTITVYRKALDLAITQFGEERELSSILLPQVGKFYAGDLVNKLPNGRPKADPTVKQIKRVFRQCLEYAKSQNWIAQIPVPKSELKHARSSSATGSSTQQPEVETPEPIEAEAPAEAETQN